ncbi:MAG: GNAT family N-acetyltransferase [Lachnospiraceae bacterium]|nr:GNAT family N-acetyltransferase [Lachnospiraceae bacterium]
MIEWKKTAGEDRAEFEKYMWDGQERGCDRSFANMCLWGQQRYAKVGDCLTFFAEWDGRVAYPYPIGPGDNAQVLKVLEEDAKERGIPLFLTGLHEKEREELEALYPGRFAFRADRGAFDYVYAIEDLAELKGKKYHGKRNHVHRFWEAHPNCQIVPLDRENTGIALAFSEVWYKKRMEEMPDSDFDMEKEAFERAIADFEALGMEGLMLMETSEDGEPVVLAVTMGNRMSKETFDVNLEKARGDVEGAYAAVNQAFARYLREKYPELCYLDREEDMGLPGLRKAKESYRPHHQIVRMWAMPIAMEEPTKDDIPALRELWKEAFGDTDAFLDTFFVQAFASERCRLVRAGFDIAAALYWFDCECRGERMAYVYAVATKEAYRKQGLSHRLLEDTHRHLKENGYGGVLLVPGSESLFRFYEGQGYEVCSGIRELFVTASAELKAAGITPEIEGLREVDASEFAVLRRQHLPDGGVIQEGANLAFLQTQAKFYAGEGVLLAAAEDEGALFGIELLGDTEAASRILAVLGYREGTFRIPGDARPFAMYYSLGSETPSYFGFAFD